MSQRAANKEQKKKEKHNSIQQHHRPKWKMHMEMDIMQMKRQSMKH